MLQSYKSSTNKGALQNAKIKSSILDFMPQTWIPILNLGMGSYYQNQYGYPKPKKSNYLTFY